jgi:putative ABC transport system substrate-binding protein
MSRREFIASIAVAAAVPAAWAQTPKPRLATLAPTSATSSPALWAAFWEGMQALGHSRDEFAVEARWAEGHPDRLPDLAAELVRLDPRVIICVGSEAGMAAKQATASIPIVLAVSSDPVGAGLVANLARPGGNATGLSLASPDIAGKHVELLKTLVPRAQRVAVLMNPHDPTHAGRAAGIIAAAKSVGVEAFTVPAATVDQLDGALAEIARSQVDALLILGTPIFNLMANDITRLSIARQLPVFSDSASAVRLGIGVMGYGADVKDLLRRAAYYVDRILKGAKPADLPVEQPTKFELIINLKTANAIGLTVPPSLLARADEVIE